MRRIVGGVFISAIVISAIGLFVRFFWVLHASFSLWSVHADCSAINAALSHGPTTMVMIIPPLFGSGRHTCAVVGFLWPTLVALGLFGVVAGLAALFWNVGKTPEA